MLPLPVVFCRDDAGRILISVSSLNLPPGPFISTDIFPVPITGVAVTLKCNRFSLFAGIVNDNSLLPETNIPPVALNVAEPLAEEEVVFVMVTGTLMESVGLRNRGSEVLNTSGSATVIFDSAEPN
jgi:hypothetical protein